MITLEQLTESGNRFVTKSATCRAKARQNGAIKTWKREPGKFLIPCKYGLYDYFYIANFDGWYNGKRVENNANLWELEK